MEQLILKKLIIASKKAQEAKIIDFDRKLTIITGDNPSGETINRTGKSLLMKSIYHSLGANLSKYTANWNNLQIVTLITFLYKNKEYTLYRDDKRFVFNDGINKRAFNSITELRTFYVDFFNFKIKLPVSSGDDNTVYAYPGAIFMPFYIDQDKGWSGSWDSFNDVFGGIWKQEILLYHLGIRTPQYYSLLEEKITLEKQQNENKRRQNTFEAIVQNHVNKYHDYLDISVSIDDFTEDIANLTNELNEQLAKRNTIKEEVVNCLSELREIEDLYLVAQKNYNELLSDADYIDNSIHEGTIVCPTCGTIHENSIENRFNLYCEIQECENTMRSYFEKRSGIEQRIRKQSEALNALNDYIQNIQIILSRKRKSVTFKEVVIAEGSKSILHDMQSDLASLKSEMATINVRLKDITKEQKAITREGKHITELYLSKLKENLSVLDVTDIDPKDLKVFKRSFDSGGNDLPCAILAQIYAICEIAIVYSHTITAPLVLDAIFQQEPAKRKIQTIFDFVINSQPKDSQLILSTTDLYGFKPNAKIVMLHTERGLLSKEDYELVVQGIEEYKALSLQKK